jgi:lysophospholipase
LEERRAMYPPLRAAVLSSPCLKLSLKVPRWKQRLADVLDVLIPRLRMESGIKPHFVSRSPQVIEAYGSDPLVGSRFSVRYFQELNKAMRLALEEAERIAVPILLLQAGQDKLVEAGQASRLFERLPQRDLNRLILYPECYHELLNEPEREEILQTILDWLELVAVQV